MKEVAFLLSRVTHWNAYLPYEDLFFLDFLSSGLKNRKTNFYSRFVFPFGFFQKKDEYLPLKNVRFFAAKSDQRNKKTELPASFSEKMQRKNVPPAQKKRVPMVWLAKRNCMTGIMISFFRI